MRVTQHDRVSDTSRFQRHVESVFIVMMKWRSERPGHYSVGAVLSVRKAQTVVQVRNIKTQLYWGLARNHRDGGAGSPSWVSSNRISCIL